MRDRIVFLSLFREGAIVLTAVLWTALWWTIGAFEAGYHPGRTGEATAVTVPLCDSLAYADALRRMTQMAIEDPYRFLPLTEQTYHDYDNARRK